MLINNQQKRCFATLSDCSGATQSHLVIIDDRGKKYGEWSHKGLNYHLEGRENVANEIAEWIRSVKKQLGMNGPLGAVVRITPHICFDIWLRVSFSN